MGRRGPGAKPTVTATAAPAKRKAKPKWQRAGLSRAERVIAFVESLKITSGMHAGRPMHLREWQRDIIRRIYDPTATDGRRIVRQVLFTVARKNGKSQLAAALALAHLVGPEAEQRGQVFSAASDRNQAAIIFREMEAFIGADPGLAGRCNIQRFAKRIEDDETGSVYEALSSDARKAHGLSPSFVVCDELAQWPDRELFDNLVTGTGARAEPLVVVISTKSADPNSCMSELVAYGRDVAAGTIDDPTFLPVIFEVPDEVDDIEQLCTDESLWRLANPALGDFRSLDEMRQMAAKALRIPTQRGPFRNLYLNQSVDPSAEHLFSPDDWKACATPVNREALRGRPCWGGLDLSSTRDLTALVLYFPDDGGAVLPFFFTPGDTLADRAKADRVPYDVWAEQGLIEAWPGRAVDKLAVARRMAQLAATFDIQGIAFDRWRMADLQKVLDDEGLDLPLRDFGQGFQSMAPAIDTLETAILSRQIAHGGHKVLTWNAANAKAETDPAGNRKVTKRKSTGRVDGIVALVMAAGLHAKEPPPPSYEFMGIVLNA
ncbi:MAG TPA: terminase TerL endonuclease subunit [Magnetospirillum sp.]|nr:terminase TerL endonuclease subunit [Magnetospirillum sp.]